MKRIKLNELQKFFKNFLFKFLYSVISLIVGILMTSYLSRTLEVDGFGKLNFLTTYASYFIFFTSLGMDIVALRLISQDNNKATQILGTVIPIKFLLSILFFIIMLLPMLFLKKMQDYGLLVVIFSLPIIISSLSPQFVFEGTKRWEFPSTINILHMIINLILIYVFVRSKSDLPAIGVISLALNFITILISHVIVMYHHGLWKLKIDLSLSKDLLSQGIIIGFIQIVAQFISYIDIILLEFLSDNTSVGLYSAAYRAMFLTIGFILIIHNLMIPILSGSYNTNFNMYKKYLDKYMKLVIFVTFGISVILIILAEPFLKMFYDLQKYQQSIICFRILMLNLFFWAVNSPLNTGLIAVKKEKILLYIVTFQLIANIIANFLLIPKYGIIGSSIATVITEAIGFPFYIYAFNKIHRSPIFKYLIIASASTIPVAFTVYFLQIHFIFRGLIGIIVMIVFAILFRGYTINEILDIKKTFFNVEKAD